MQCVDAVGGFWGQARKLKVMLLKKPEGVKRTIGLYDGCFRIWGEIKKSELKELEAKRGKDQQFSVAPRKDVTDAV